MSKLALGSVQFGMDYGISNTGGRVPFREVEKILNLAMENGINTLDTAPGYGNSEQVLGEIGVNDFHIVTKTIPLKLGVDNVLQSFYQSLIDLNTTSVDGLLIHNISDIKDKQFDALYKELNKLKQDKVINKIGFSTYIPNQVDFLLDNFDFDLIQVPFNVFDTRLVEGGQLQKLKNKKIEIHARSVFLQGILLNFHSLPEYFSTWREQFVEYQLIVKESGLSLLEYALNFVIGFEEIDKVIIGVENCNQLQEAISSLEVKNNINYKDNGLNDPFLVNPSNWRK
jgi:aryl-alcohol dehydrogenase-like predicted oxidoreductase